MAKTNSSNVPSLSITYWEDAKFTNTLLKSAETWLQIGSLTSFLDSVNLLLYNDLSRGCKIH